MGRKAHERRAVRPHEQSEQDPNAPDGPQTDGAETTMEEAPEGPHMGGAGDEPAAAPLDLGEGTRVLELKVRVPWSPDPVTVSVGGSKFATAVAMAVAETKPEGSAFDPGHAALQRGGGQVLGDDVRLCDLDAMELEAEELCLVEILRPIPASNPEE